MRNENKVGVRVRARRQCEGYVYGLGCGQARILWICRYVIAESRAVSGILRILHLYSAFRTSALYLYPTERGLPTSQPHGLNDRAGNCTDHTRS